MKKVVMFLLVSLLSLGLACITYAAKAPLYNQNNVLVGANFNDAPGSSDMTLIFRLTADGKILVDEGSPVKYITSPDNADIVGWTQANYDDSAWKDGISGVGFADNDDNTTVPTGLVSIWTRYYFDAPNADSVKELILLADYDDQYVAWLNGVKIAASAGAPAEDPPAWNATEAGGVNRGSAELPAGKPNEARWSAAQIEKVVVDFEFVSASPVEAKGKITATWASLKKADD